MDSGDLADDPGLVAPRWGTATCVGTPPCMEGSCLLLAFPSSAVAFDEAEGEAPEVGSSLEFSLAKKSLAAS